MIEKYSIQEPTMMEHKHTRVTKCAVAQLVTTTVQLQARSRHGFDFEHTDHSVVDVNHPLKAIPPFFV